VEIDRSSDSETVGRFHLELAPADRDDIYLRAVDAAGNRSDVVSVEQVRWTAAFAETAPHNVAEVESVQAVLQQPRGLVELQDGAEFARGRAVQASHLRRWRVHATGPAPTRVSAAAAYNTHDGKLYQYGGISAGGTSIIRYGDTWTWDGTEWSRPTTSEISYAR